MSYYADEDELESTITDGIDHFLASLPEDKRHLANERS